MAIVSLYGFSNYNQQMKGNDFLLPKNDFPKRLILFYFKKRCYFWCAWGLLYCFPPKRLMGTSLLSSLFSVSRISWCNLQIIGLFSSQILENLHLSLTNVSLWRDFSQVLRSLRSVVQLKNSGTLVFDQLPFSLGTGYRGILELVSLFSFQNPPKERK